MAWTAVAERSPSRSAASGAETISAAIIAERGETAQAPALVVQPQARRALFSLLRLRAPGCLVIAISELPPAQPIEVIAVIGRDPPPPALPSPQTAEPASYGALAA